MPGFAGTLTLYIDKKKVGEGEIVTQPGYFCLVGDGICVGRDSASPVTPEYTAPFRFTGGTIDKVVVDVSGEKFVDHEKQVDGLVRERLTSPPRRRHAGGLRGDRSAPRRSEVNAPIRKIVVGALGVLVIVERRPRAATTPAAAAEQSSTDEGAIDSVCSDASDFGELR